MEEMNWDNRKLRKNLSKCLREKEKCIKKHLLSLDKDTLVEMFMQKQFEMNFLEDMWKQERESLLKALIQKKKEVSEKNQKIAVLEKAVNIAAKGLKSHCWNEVAAQRNKTLPEYIIRRAAIELVMEEEGDI